jgi:cytochrome c oxidase subunit 2
VSACHDSASVFVAAGPASRSIGRLGAGVMIALCVVALAVIGLLLWATFRRSGSLAEHEPVETGGGQEFIFVGGFLLPIVVLAVVLIATLSVVNRFPLHEDGHFRPDIRIVGRQWWWEIDYEGGDGHSTRVVSANELHIPTNWPVEIELESRDVIHSFWVPALHGKVDLIPGHPNRIRIQADVAGRYPGQCAEFCGAQHALMNFSVVAEPLDEYESWLAHEAAPASAASDPDALRGRALFEGHACGLCHRIRGTAAQASVGPDLTHFASRAELAAASYPNTRAYLEAWATHAQSLKPGAQMPDISDFSGDELQSLSHFLEGLK